MPKIYFYDTGIACFLLGIDTSDKLTSHHLRGSLFENLAICELMKRRYNDGKDPNLYFYREKSGIEVDAIAIENASLHLYEIKARETLHQEDYKNIKELESKLSEPVKKTIIFNGETLGSAINIRDI